MKARYNIYEIPDEQDMFAIENDGILFARVPKDSLKFAEQIVRDANKIEVAREALKKVDEKNDCNQCMMSCGCGEIARDTLEKMGEGEDESV